MNITVDPRTILLAVAVINMIVMASPSTTALFCCAAVTSAALATVRIRYGVIAILTFSFLYLVFQLLLLIPGSKGVAFAAVMFMWLARFAVSVGIGAWAILGISPSALTAALRSLRIGPLRLPSWLTIPPAVFLRVLPIAVTEARAIYDAMLLRGLRPGARQWLLHPVQSTSMLVIPLLGTVVQSSDDLAAAALIRGLGGTRTPTTIARLSLRAADVWVLTSLVAIVSAAWWLP